MLTMNRPKPVPSTVNEVTSWPTSSPSRMSAANPLNTPAETKMKGRMIARLSPASITGRRSPNNIATTMTKNAVPMTRPSTPMPR